MLLFKTRKSVSPRDQRVLVNRQADKHYNFPVSLREKASFLNAGSVPVGPTRATRKWRLIKLLTTATLLAFPRFLAVVYSSFVGLWVIRPLQTARHATICGGAVTLHLRSPFFLLGIIP